MKNRSLVFIWSLGWWLEDDKAWFVDGVNNTLFCVDMQTGECEKVITIPYADGITYRPNPFCMKCGRELMCIPGVGNSIWIYNLDEDIFTEMKIDISELHIFASQFWRRGDMVYIAAGDWNKVIEVNIKQRVIMNYFTICENDSIRRSVWVGNSIYMVSSGFGKIYQFDTVSKKVTTHLLPDFDRKLFTICFDGDKFWLSGYRKEVYVWDKEMNSITILDSFPEKFESVSVNGISEDVAGNYTWHVFNQSVAVGENIWFIPRASEDGKILYANRETLELSVFEIYDEEVSVLSKRPYEIACYLLEYVKDNRYIGLFSAKSNRIFEIDTKQLSYQWIGYYFSEKCLKQCSEKIYYEGQRNELFVQAIGVCTADCKTAANSIGMKIHSKLN